MHHWSVRSQLVMLVLAVAIPLAFVGAYFVGSEIQMVEQRAEQTTFNLAEATVSNVRNFLRDSEDLLERLVEDRGLADLDLASCNATVQDVAALFPGFANAFVAVDGRVFCSALPVPEGFSTEGLQWWEGVKGTRRFTVGRPRMGRISNQWIVVLAYPILDEAGQFIGALGATVDLVRFQRLLAAQQLPEGAVITLQDRDGTVVARSEDSAEWVGRKLPDTGLAPDHATRPSGTSRARDAGGTQRLWAYVNVGEPDWRVYAGVGTDWAFGPVRSMALRLGIAAMLALLVGVTATFRIYRRIDSSLSNLVRGTQAAARGSHEPIPTEGPQEVVQVADQFNVMLAARAQAEAELRDAEQRFRSILQHAAFGIYLADADGRFLEVNPALAEMLGYENPTELRSVRVREIYEEPEIYTQVLETCVRESGVHRWEVGWKRRDGTSITVRLTASAFPGSQGEAVVEVISEDVTEHRALEAQFRQAQKMQAIGRLAGGVAHDFNNLLTVINGEARLILEDAGQSETVHDSVHQILESGERAAALTRQLLAFSRREASAPVPTDLNGVIESLERMLQRLIGAPVTLVLELADEPERVLMDPGRLEQVLMNLVLNGRDAMPQGGRLTIRTRWETLGKDDVGRRFPGVRPGRYALLSVSDTGVGMGQEVQQRIFEPFFTTKPEGQGTGLGLSTVYGIVSQGGGHVTVESGRGRGSTFTVLLPILERPGRSASDPAASGRDLNGAGESRPTVLVVEDERSVRDMVCRVLDRRGFRVLSAANGDQALQQAERFTGPIHLVLTDVRMPVMNGPQMARRMADLRPEARILFMSGYADDMGIPVTVRQDSASFIAKPFSPAELLDRIAAILGRGTEPPRRPTMV